MNGAPNHPLANLEHLTLRKRNALVFGALCLGVVLAPWASFLLRFDFRIPAPEWHHLLLGMLIYLPVKLVSFYSFNVHRGWWTPVGVIDLRAIVLANLLASGVSTILILLSIGTGFPRSVYLLDCIFTTLAICAARLVLRIYRDIALRQIHSSQKTKAVLVYGAGEAGAALLREIWNNPKAGYRVVGFLDDDTVKRNEVLSGVRILGSGRDAVRVVENLKGRDIRVEEILITMPAATGRQMREVVANCRAAGVPCKTLPGIGDLLTGKALARQIRNISVEDLLSREPVELDEAGIRGTIANHVVMVTGAAGSIGSELCRQIAEYGPRKLSLFDRAESDLFRIDLQLRTQFSSLDIFAEIADMRDQGRVRELLRKHRVNAIYHAAAYKHVPLMEAHPLEAAGNNILGTWNLALAAREYGVKTFVMISSDKAVNPTNVMGVTKRACELIVSSFPPPDGDIRSPRFVSVRFGNVLASNGSVVPTFQGQIAAGGPVTVTHPEVRRYFMTVREAVQLVLQASTMASGGEIYVLDMGEPVRIVDLARNMIRLAGYMPDEEIEIRYTGLRPGEKLFEELITEGEHILPTRHQKIKIFKGPSFKPEVIGNWVAELSLLLKRHDEPALITHLSALVPEYEVSPQWLHVLPRRTVAKAAAAEGEQRIGHAF